MTSQSSSTKRIVIIGAGYGGLMAALRLSHQPGLTVTVINASEHFAERIRLHQRSTGQRLHVFDLNRLLHNVNFIPGIAQQIQPADKTITVETRGEHRQIAYDTLVYALGSRIDRSVPGVAEFAYTVDQPAAIAEALHKQPNRILVIGGGLTGIETATEIAERYPHSRVTLATSDRLGAGLSDAGQRYLRKVFDRLHIDVCESTRITRVQAHGAITDRDACLPFDLCVWTAGFAVSSLAQEAGLTVNARDQVIVDQHLRSVSHPDIYAVGDAAALHDPSGIKLRMACATALPMGAYAADNIRDTVVGKPEHPFRFGYVGQCISLGRQRGLLQLVNPDDSPKNQIITGIAGRMIKELICQSTIWSLRIERFQAGSYRWPQTLP